MAKMSEMVVRRVMLRDSAPYFRIHIDDPIQQYFRQKYIIAQFVPFLNEQAVHDIFMHHASDEEKRRFRARSRKSSERIKFDEGKPLEEVLKRRKKEKKKKRKKEKKNLMLPSALFLKCFRNICKNVSLAKFQKTLGFSIRYLYKLYPEL